MHPVDIVLIDLDGTISDSSPGMLTGFRKVFDRFDMEQPSDESIRRHFGPPLAVTWREVYGMTDEQIVVGLEVYREYYHDVGMFENNLYDGIPELIKDLHGDGVTLSTATSKPEFSASRIIEHFGLREYFTFIGAADLAGTRDDKSAVIAHTLESDDLITWVKALAGRMEKSGKILTPALIVGDDIDLAARGLMKFAATENWYFDLVDVEHVSSIAIRAANLIRIHDHIHELGRYENSITKLENQVKDLLERLP